MPHDGSGHDADWTGACNQDVFAQNGKRQRHVDGVSEWIEDRRDFQRDAWAVPPDIRHGDNHVFGKCPVAVYADTFGEGTEMTPPGEAVATASANDVSFPADDLTRLEIGNVRANLNDLANELMAQDGGNLDGRLRPAIPVINVYVSPANSREQGTNLYVVDANLRFGNILKPQATLGTALHQCFHSVSTADLLV